MRLSSDWQYLCVSRMSCFFFVVNNYREGTFFNKFEQNYACNWFLMINSVQLINTNRNSFTSKSFDGAGQFIKKSTLRRLPPCTLIALWETIFWIEGGWYLKRRHRLFCWYCTRYFLYLYTVCMSIHAHIYIDKSCKSCRYMDEITIICLLVVYCM